MHNFVVHSNESACRKSGRLGLEQVWCTAPFFVYLLLSSSPDLNIFCMLLFCISLFPLIRDASPPVVSMDILNSSTSKFVTSVEFAKAPSLSTLTRLHGCCSFFGVFRMKSMMLTGDFLDAVGNTHSILVFAQTTVSMEVNPRMGFTFLKENYMWISSPGWRIMVSTDVPLLRVVIFLCNRFYMVLCLIC